MMNKVVFFICLFLGGALVCAQGEDMEATPKAPKKKNDIIMGAGITGTGFYGDLNYTDEGIFGSDFFSFYPGFNFMLRPEAPKRFLPMLNLGYGKFVSQNPDLDPVLYQITSPEVKDSLIQPNKFAETFIVYGDLGVHINLIRRFAPVRPHLGVGLGMVAFFPRSADGIPLVRKKSSRAPSERTFEAISYSLPLTAGVDFNLGRRVGFNLAYTYRVVGTDYLDNIAELGQQKGNDKLHSIRLGANFRIFGEKPESIYDPFEPELPDSMIASSGDPRQTSESSGKENIIDVAVVESVDTTFIPRSKPDCDTLAAKYEARLAELRREKNILNRRYESLKARVEELDQNNDSLMWELASKEALLANLPSSDPKVSQENNPAQAEAERLNKELKETLKDLAELQTRNEQMTSELKAVNQTLEIMKKQGTDTDDTELTLLNTELRRFKSINENVIETNDSLMYELGVQYGKVDSLKTVVREYRLKNPETSVASGQANEIEAKNKKIQSQEKELYDLKKLIADREKELERVKNSMIDDKGKEMETYLSLTSKLDSLNQASMTVRNEMVSMKEENQKLELVNNSLEEQLEDNLNYVKENVREKELMMGKLAEEKARSNYYKAVADSALRMSRINSDGKEELAASIEKSRGRVKELITTLTKVKSEKSADQIRINRLSDSLNFEIAFLEKQLTSMSGNLAVNSDNSARLDEKERILDNLQIKLETQEQLLNQREISLKQRAEQVKKQEDKYLALEEKEKELKLLEQQLKQMQANGGNKPSSATTGKVAVSPNSSLQVPAFLAIATVDKEVVKERITKYFEIRGYEYTIENGKLVYRGVVVPDVSQVKYDVTFYLVRTKYGRRQLVATFKTVGGEYLSETLNPVESKNAKEFISNLAN